jgi:hypothetical protein
MYILVEVGDEPAVATLSYKRPYFDNTIGSPSTMEMVIPFTSEQMGTQGPKEFGNSIFKMLAKTNPESIKINDRPVNLDRDEIASAFEEATRRG